MSADGGWEVDSEEVYGAGVTVVADLNEGVGAVLRGELCDGAGDDVDFLLPAEAVCVELGEQAAGPVFAVR